VSSGQVPAGSRFGGLLRRYRLARGLTQEELAGRSGLTPRTVANIERGRTRPYRRSVSSLADALGLSEPERAELDRASRLIADTSPAPVEQPSPRTGRVLVPRQLPAPVTHFAGRREELAALTHLLAERGAGTPGTVVISAIGGTAGVGKTALALHWAHQVSDRFPDGQLYVNLRGYDEGEPVSAATALASLLRALGVTGADLPADPEERSAVYRSLLSGRKMLIVLDNAGRAEQVRPLLPGSPACVTVVTSRDTLAGLVAREGATRMDLDLLPLADAVDLLQRLIGARAAAAPDAAARLATCCCRLPLALRVAAELAAARPEAPLAALAVELADRQRRLDLLDAGGDGQTAVREVFSWSYRHLAPQTARAFRLAALHPGTDFDGYALAALTGSTHQQASGMLRELTRAHLIQPADALRYGMHDLLRAFGHELAEGSVDSQPALTGLLDYLRYAAARAMGILFPAETDQRPRIQDPPSLVPPITDQQSARAWLDSERVNLAAAVNFAADQGWPGHAVGLAAILSRYLNVGGYFSEARTVAESAVRAAARTGDRPAEAQALINLANICLRQSCYQQAIDYFERAQDLCRLTADRITEFRVLSGLAMINQMQGRYPQAAGYFQQILDLGRSTGSQFQQIRGLLGLGTIALLCGRYQQAGSQLQQAVQICDEIGDGVLLAGALINLGDLHLRQGRYQQARSCFERSRTVCGDTGDQVADLHAVCYLALTDLRQGRYPQAADQLGQAVDRFRASGYRTGEAQALSYLGELNLRRERYQQAQEDLEQALAICADTDDLPGQTEVLNVAGELFLATGKLADARTHYGHALRLAGQLSDPYQQARAHRGLGDVHAAAGDNVPARHHWNEALARFTTLETPEADKVRAQLTVDVTP
jgi:tetratricopeptide (TPR) repeat protein/transcriptional regulator with XRE-family HTH domain